MSEHIQINDVSPRVQYVADGVQLAFTYPFAVFAIADLEVWLDDMRQTTGFTLSGVGVSHGGSVLFGAPPAAGTWVTLRRRLALARTTDFQADGVIRAKTLNDELDYQIAALQQVAEEVARSPRRSPLSASTANLTLPEPAPSRGLKWNSDGTALVNTVHDPDITGDATQAAATAVLAAGQAVTARDEAQAAVGGVRISADDVLAGPLAVKLQAGDGIVLTESNGGGDGRLVVSSTVTVPTAIFDRLDFLERNLAVNTLRDQIDAGWSVLNMVDGIADEFADQDGVLVSPPIDANTKLLVHADGDHGGTTFTDASPGGLTVTRVGVPVTSTAQAKFGGSSAFLGSETDSWYLSVAHNVAHNLAGDFTIDLWAYLTGSETAYGFARKSNGDGGSAGWAFVQNGTGVEALALYCNGNAVAVSSSTQPPRDRWFHIAAVRSGNNWYLFLDGALVGSAVNSVAITSSTASLDIGMGATFSSAWAGHADYQFPGYIDEFRISDTARWTASFTPPAHAYGALLPGYSSGQFYDVTGDCYDNLSFGALDTVTDLSDTATWTAPDGRSTGLANLIDGNTATYTSGVSTYAGTAAFVFRAQLAAPRLVQRVRQHFYSGQSGHAGGRVKISADGTTWTTVATFGPLSNGNWYTHDFTTNTARVAFVQIEHDYSTANWPNLGEAEIFAAAETIADMVLASRSFTAEMVPGEARLVLLHEPLSAVTLDIDCTIEASRDGGATWTAGTLSNEGAFDPATDILSAVIDLTAQPAGTAMCWRFKTLNTKPQRLHGAWMQWR